MDPDDVAAALPDDRRLFTSFNETVGNHEQLVVQIGPAGADAPDREFMVRTVGAAHRVVCAGREFGSRELAPALALADERWTMLQKEAGEDRRPPRNARSRPAGGGSDQGVQAPQAPSDRPVHGPQHRVVHTWRQVIHRVIHWWG